MSFVEVPFNKLVEMTNKDLYNSFYITFDGETPKNDETPVELELILSVTEDGETYDGEGGIGEPVILLLSERHNPYMVYAVESDNATDAARRAVAEEEPNAETVKLYEKSSGGRKKRRMTRKKRKSTRKTRKHLYKH